MTTPPPRRCYHATFTTARVARRAAWAMEPDRRKRLVPAECPDCGTWRLVAPEQEGPAS